MKAQPAQWKVLPAVESCPCLDLLSRLREDYGVCALKLSTEDAGMSFEQIRFWARQCRGLMPVMVKIGGPNARNDIRELVSSGIDGLIAPMVESPYGLENFMSALRTCTQPRQFAGIKKQINVETLTATFHLDAMLALPEALELDEITIGCTDLSQSMGLQVTHPRVTELVEQCIQRIRRKGIPVSIGGGITPGNVDLRLEKLAPSHFNTRVLTFPYLPGREYGEAVRQALHFELEMLDLDLRKGFLKPAEARARMKELRSRLG